MMTKLEGSPVQVFKLAAQAAPNGGLIAMQGSQVAASAVNSGNGYEVTVNGRVVATVEGNTSTVAAFLHGYFMGQQPEVRED